MTIKYFEEIIAWQRAMDLTAEVYLVFEQSRDFGFRDQIRRASVSIMNNIAEGFERQTDREFRQALFIAKGSCAEVRSMLYLAEKLNMIDSRRIDQLQAQSLEVAKILSGLIRSIPN